MCSLNSTKSSNSISPFPSISPALSLIVCAVTLSYGTATTSVIVYVKYPSFVNTKSYVSATGN